MSILSSETEEAAKQERRKCVRCGHHESFHTDGKKCQVLWCLCKKLVRDRVVVGWFRRVAAKYFKED